MGHVTSRGFKLPPTARGMAEFRWFNLWSKKQWPYEELSVGNSLGWYESSKRSIVWESQVVEVEQLRYESKAEAQEYLGLSEADAAQAYFADAPSAGYCLSYSIDKVRPLNVTKPDTFKFPQLGWLRVAAVRDQWPALTS